MIEFLQNNWFWIAVVGLFLFMQASGMSCCGHEKHKAQDGSDSTPEKDQ